MAPVVEKVCPAAELGEGPHWDIPSQTLYYVDILGCKILRYVPATKEHASVQLLGGTAGFVVPLEGQPGTFVTGLKKRLVLTTWDGQSEQPQVVENVAEVDTEPGKENHRFNDAKADPSGRLWAGTMCAIEDIPKGLFNASLFSFEADRKPKIRQSNIGLSNGLAWSKDQKTMYYIDSLKGSVDAYDFDINTGEQSNRRVVLHLEKSGISGIPDGMTIDAEDKLWVAVFDGGKVLRVDPSTGKIVSTVDIPAPKVTSVAFGGANLDELFVTTARMGMSKEMREKYPDSGCTFRVTGLGVKGLPAYNAKL